MTEPVTLFSTAGCHLCEQAEGLLSTAGARWQVVDIAADPALLEAYGVRIPVLKRGDGAELGWPFGLPELEDFLGG